MAGPAYTRMQLDERRGRLLELGAERFATAGAGDLLISLVPDGHDA